MEAERVVTVGLYHTLRSLVAPVKQGPADDGKRLDSLSPAMDVALPLIFERKGGGLGEGVK